MRALVPTGWMYTPSEHDGGLHLEICGGHWEDWDPSYSVFETNEDDPKDPLNNEGEQSFSCPYALTSLSISTELTTESDAVLALTGKPTRPYVRGPPVDRRNQPVLPARGPPLFL